MKFSNLSPLSEKARPESCVKVLISSGEASSDIHGARMLDALREQLPPGTLLDAYGVGGPQLQAAGLRAVVDTRELMTIGFLEVFLRLPKIFKILNQVFDEAKLNPPDVAIVIDYPGFHFRLARKLKKLKIPIIYYIPPKIWVWRKHRVRILKEFFDKVLCILPFEESLYRDLGLPVKFVGNPLLDELPLELSRTQARAKLGLSDQDHVLVIMPGSRESELNHHLDIFLSAVRLTLPALVGVGYFSSGSGSGSDQVSDSGIRVGDKLIVLIPFPDIADIEMVRLRVRRWSELNGLEQERNSQWSGFLDLRVSQGNSAVCLVAADAGLIKSGTSTLEAGLLKCPHVVVYKPNPTTGWVFKNIMRYKGFVGLVNLISGQIVPEVLCEDVTPEILSKHVFNLLTDREIRGQMLSGFDRLRTTIGNGVQSPSAVVAKEVMELVSRNIDTRNINTKNVGNGNIRNRNAEKTNWNLPVVMKSVLIGTGSSLWALLSSLARFLSSIGFIQPKKLDARVISVGNIQAGGAGKTPLVAQIANEAAELGLKVCILIRGYKGSWESKGGILIPGGPRANPDESGDEAALLHELCPNAYIGIGASRYRQYQSVLAQAQVPIDLVILDDGFQNWRIKKDLEIVALTSSKPWQVLFRDRSIALRNANLLVWTKGDQEPNTFGMPRVRVRFEIPSVQNQAVWLVTGVADEESVYQSAIRSGYRVIKRMRFEDHARYDRGLIRKILIEARMENCAVAITGKDWVKWNQLGVLKSEVVILALGLVFEEGQDLWSRSLWDQSINLFDRI